MTTINPTALSSVLTAPQNTMGRFVFFLDCQHGAHGLDKVTDKIVVTPNANGQTSLTVYKGTYDRTTGATTFSTAPTATYTDINALNGKIDADLSGKAEADGGIDIVPVQMEPFAIGATYTAGYDAPLLNAQTPAQAIDLNGDRRAELVLDPSRITDEDLGANAFGINSAIIGYAERQRTYRPAQLLIVPGI